jgi:hypothetical protein
MRSEKYDQPMDSIAIKESKSGTGISVGPGTVESIVENHLPDEAADSLIISEFSKIDDKINNHVQSFFKGVTSGNYDSLANVALREVGNKIPLTGTQIIKVLANVNNQTVVLRFLIAWIIVSRMALESSPESSLLPPGIAQAIQSMADIRSNDKGTLTSSRTMLMQANFGYTVRMAFLTKWRTVTAFLMNITASQTTSSSTTTIPESNIQKAATYINSIVAPYASKSDENAARLKNLEEIVRRASRVTAILFSQPVFWRFDWVNDSNGFVVFPGLVKITDSTGNILKDPIIFSEKRIVNV